MKNFKFNFNNIFGIMKYTFISLRIPYIIEAVVFGLAFLPNLFISKISHGVDLIPAISIALIINFISHLVVLARQLSKEEGRLLSLTPVTGGELLLANFLELLSVDLIITIIPFLWSYILSGKTPSLLISIIIPEMYGLILGYLVLAPIIAIASSYIASTGLRVLAVILGSVIGNSIYDFISNGILNLLPYFYFSFNGIYSGEIDIFAFIFGLIIIIGLYIFAAHNINKKLDIL